MSVGPLEAAQSSSPHRSFTIAFEEDDGTISPVLFEYSTEAIAKAMMASLHEGDRIELSLAKATAEVYQRGYGTSIRKIRQDQAAGNPFESAFHSATSDGAFQQGFSAGEQKLLAAALDDLTEDLIDEIDGGPSAPEKIKSTFDRLVERAKHCTKGEWVVHATSAAFDVVGDLQGGMTMTMAIMKVLGKAFTLACQRLVGGWIESKRLK